MPMRLKSPVVTKNDRYQVTDSSDEDSSNDGEAVKKKDHGRKRNEENLTAHRLYRGQIWAFLKDWIKVSRLVYKS